MSRTKSHRAKKREGRGMDRLGSSVRGKGRSTSAALERREEERRRWYVTRRDLSEMMRSLDVAVNRSTRLKMS